jgi:hypothetical protein
LVNTTTALPEGASERLELGGGSIHLLRGGEGPKSKRERERERERRPFAEYPGWGTRWKPRARSPVEGVHRLHGELHVFGSDETRFIGSSSAEQVTLIERVAGPMMQRGSS